MIKFIEKIPTLHESRILIDVRVTYFSNSNSFTLSAGSDNKMFFGTPEEFRKVLQKYKFIDSATKPKSKRQTTYKQMVDDIISGKDNKVVIWSNNFVQIPYRFNSQGSL